MLQWEPFAQPNSHLTVCTSADGFWIERASFCAGRNCHEPGTSRYIGNFFCLDLCLDNNCRFDFSWFTDSGRQFGASPQPSLKHKLQRSWRRRNSIAGRSLPSPSSDRVVHQRASSKPRVDTTHRFYRGKSAVHLFKTSTPTYSCAMKACLTWDAQESEEVGRTGLTDTSEDEVFSRFRFAIRFWIRSSTIFGPKTTINNSNSNFWIFSQEYSRGEDEDDPDYHLDVRASLMFYLV